jgi:ubiquinone/menaquinone biosynthesis C-methylase UbiE
MAPELQRWIQPEACCDPEWEAAYSRFETPAEEERKFLTRLRRFGVDHWRRDLQVVDIFCGRGGGLKAWTELGFQRLEGVDLSENLLRQYSGDAQLYVGDCRRMAFADASRDVICVQGGLHHLPVLPGDLNAVVAEVHRVLRPGGKFMIVEPWLTPFLRLVHRLCRQPLVLRISPKFEALACMIRREERTYFQWLSNPEVVRASLGRGFETLREDVSFGKLMWIGRKPLERPLSVNSPGNPPGAAP